MQYSYIVQLYIFMEGINNKCYSWIFSYYFIFSIIYIRIYSTDRRDYLCEKEY
jgi:hypothetical protein